MLPAVLLASLASAPARAASYDPALHWRTLRTEHFSITFHEGEEQIAEEMADAAEGAWSALTVEIENAPRRPVNMVLVDWTDTANGYATIVPSNTIVIFVTAPEDDSTLALYEDWNSAIVTHELTHILHLDTVRGLPRAVRYLMGSLISTHQVSPGWIVEGYATFEETRHTGAGRGRNASVDMIKRAAVLEDRFPPLGNMDGYQVLPPGGNLRYLFGQDFMQFIADRTGAGKWTEWVQRYGASVPYILPAKQVFGESFVKLYREWHHALDERYRAQAARIEAEGVTPLRFLSPEGDSCGAPSWSPDGARIAWSCTSPKVGGRVLVADADGNDPEVVIKDKSATNLAWRSDSRAFAFTTTHTVDLYHSLEDVYLYDLDEDRLSSMTSGKRARDPAFSPDGTRMVVVTNEAQENQLAVLTVDKQLRPITHTAGHTQYGTPRWSPDGRLLALTVWKDGLRDLWLYTPDGMPWRRLTADTAIERDVAWSADGKWLYFASDRSGVPSIYAIEVATEKLFKVTNVLTGAYGPSPSPDGKRLVFQYFSTPGTRVAMMDLDPARFVPQGVLPRIAGQPGGSITGPPIAAALPTPVATSPSPEASVAASSVATPDPGTAAGAASVSAAPAASSAPTEAGAAAPSTHPRADAAGPYNPLPTLLPPRYWIPGGLLTTLGTCTDDNPLDCYGVLAFAQTSGYDVLQYFAYSAYATYRTDAAFLGGGGSFTINRWRPVLSIGGSTSVSPYGDVYRSSPSPAGGGATLPGIETTRQRYWDRRIHASVQLGYPTSEYTSVSAWYSGTLRSPLDPLPDDVYVPALPTRGFFSSVGVGWKYGKGTSYALSISPEKARSLAVSAEITPSWLGSYTFDDSGAKVAFDQLQVIGEWREYVTNPLIPNHVLAWKLAGGASFGDKFRYGSFRLGGPFSENGITVVPAEWRSLRGFNYASDSGEWYWLASTEYRFPIVNIDRGVGTFPLFVRNVSAAVVADAGNAFDDAAGASLDQTLLGVGAELRLNLIWGYGIPLTSRLGYAFSVFGDGWEPGDLNGLYAVLGSSF